MPALGRDQERSVGAGRCARSLGNDVAASRSPEGNLGALALRVSRDRDLATAPEKIVMLESAGHDLLGYVAVPLRAYP